MPLRTFFCYQCLACPYVYDEVKGDPEHGVKPGTKFKDIPDTWVCPVCGVGKDMFRLILEKKGK